MSESEGAAVRFPPPFVPLIGLVVGLVIQRFIPLSIAGGGVRWGLGTVLVVAGLALMGLAFGWFRKTGQDPKPWTEAPELIVEGFYRHSRNPMYVALAIGLLAVAARFDNLWLLVSLAAWFPVMVRGVISREERYLEDKFGETYTSYKSRVRRWV